MTIGESFQIAAIIKKSLPFWKEFKNYFKHKCKEMELKDLIARLMIKEITTFLKKIEIHTCLLKLIWWNSLRSLYDKKHEYTEESSKSGDSKCSTVSERNCDKSSYYGKNFHMLKALYSYKKKKYPITSLIEHIIFVQILKI